MTGIALNLYICGEFSQSYWIFQSTNMLYSLFKFMYSLNFNKILQFSKYRICTYIMKNFHLFCISNYYKWYFNCNFLIFLLLFVLVAQSCPTLCNPIDYKLVKLLCPWNYSGKNTGVGCHFLPLLLLVYRNDIDFASITKFCNLANLNT